MPRTDDRRPGNPSVGPAVVLRTGFGAPGDCDRLLEADLGDVVEIAESEDHEVQAALSSAYERGLLKGRKLLMARKIIENRRRRGKGLAATDRQRNQRVSAEALVKAYQEDTDRKRSLIQRANATRDRLLIIIEALRRLAQDERFVALLEDEDLATLPQNLMVRIRPEAGASG